jgi:hypothetical protein
MSTPVHTRPTTPSGPSRSGRARPIIAVIAVVAFLALIIVVLRVLSDGGTTGSNAAQKVTIPLGGRQAADVKIDSGADNIRISTADLGGDLAVVTTPEGTRAGIAPKAEMTGDSLRVWTLENGDAEAGATTTIDVQIAQGVKWDVAILKGGRQIKLDLGTAKLGSVELSGGADKADVTLPKPDGELVAKIPTGLAEADFHVLPGVLTRAVFAKGAGSASLDGAKKVGLEPGAEMNGTGAKKGFDAAKDRVRIDVSAGIGVLVVDRNAS